MNTETLSVLSWNVCWGCMYGEDKSKFDTTAKYLAYNKCYNNGNPPIPSCFKNISNTIENILNNNNNLDFIGIQEAAKWEDLYNQTSQLQQSFGYINSFIMKDKKTRVDIVLFYRANKYKILGIKVGNIIDDGSDARPYQHVFFQNKENGKKFVVTNLHNGHGISKDNLERALSKNINHGKLITDDIINVSDLDGTENDSLDSLLSNFDEHDYYIIMGDFNDHGRYNYWEKLNPFRYTNISNLQGIIQKCNNEPPKTCCVPTMIDKKLRTSIGQDTMYGDYILVSNNVRYSQDLFIPYQFNQDAQTNPTSDHLPIMSELEYVVSIDRTQSQQQTQTQTPKQPEEIPIQNTIIEYKLKDNLTSKTLRLQDNLEDPYKKINNNKFKGKKLNSNKILIYPNGNIITLNDNKGKKINYVFVQSEQNKNKIGYVNNDYLEEINGINKFKLMNNYHSKTLRLEPVLIDPNTEEGKSIKGFTISKDEILIKPNGEETLNGLVIVQDKNDPTTIGYIRKEYIKPIQENDYKSKYLKYKSKYLKLKSIIV